MSNRFNQVLDGYLSLRWEINPVEATYHGIHEKDGVFGRCDAESIRIHLAALKSYEHALEEVETEGLEDEIDRTAVLQAVRHDILSLDTEKGYERNPGMHLTHALTGLYLLLARATTDPAQRARALIARVQALPAFLEHAAEALKRPDKGFIEMAQGMIVSGQALVHQSLTDAILAPASVDAGEVGCAREAALEALAAFGDELVRMKEKAGDTYAIGRELFDRKVRTWHLLSEDADQLFRFGEKLRDEALAELDRRAHEIKAGAGWREVAAELKQDRPTRDQALGEFTTAMRGARDFIAKRGLMKVPDAPLDVIETPEFLRTLVPYAAYQGPGAFDGPQRGTFFVTLPPPGETWRADCRAELASTAVHEGYPGHHLQIVTGNSLSRRVRRVIATPASREGWALYCESLMAEEGYLKPAERFFQAQHLLWRALRVILDVSLQTRGMTWPEASRILQDTLGFEAPLADAEARRYCAYPTYQLCYAAGRREILKLREDAKKERGTKFSLAKFHEELLSYGSYPTALARWGMGLAR